MLLGEIFIYADGNPDTIRVCLFELLAFFSRTATESGVPIYYVNLINSHSFNIIRDNPEFKEICFRTGDVMEKFIKLIGSYHNPKNPSEKLSKAINYIMNNYMKELTLKNTSDAIFVSAFYLSHLFRKEMNTTFSDYLCKVRIEKAKGLLKTGIDFRIQEIAEQTGFSNPNYFAKSFKKITEISPKEYKNLFRN
jgi:two-component system response regulator YesN